MFSTLRTFCAIFVLLHTSLCHSKTSAFVKYTRQTNEYLSVTHEAALQMYSSNVTSGVRCAILCNQDDNCLAVNYNRNSTICEMMFGDPCPVTVYLVPRVDWDVFHKPCPCIQEQGVCAENWTHYGNHCYYVNKEKKTWNRALQYCQDNYDAGLVDICDDAENDVMTELANRYQELRFWIGLTDKEVENNWKWSTGRNCTYERFGQEEPNNDKGNENCVVVAHGLWNDVNCTSEVSSICKLAINV